MIRNSIQTNNIALLATGDEISDGDILNTNTQAMARQLLDQGMQVGMHMVTSDNVSEIEQAIVYLLQHHRALIITGGLGPTSDDITRIALAQAIHQPLDFDEDTWENIVSRLKHFGYQTPPESNRQQAYFPRGATIILNPNGTAAGCMIQYQNQPIFMLPGPPNECLPMFKNFVLPELKKLGFEQIEYREHWFLFGVSEAQIAEVLDALAKPYDCVTGYRLTYPYIEFKIRSSHKQDFDTVVPLIKAAANPYLIGDGKHFASELLRNKLEKLTDTLTICDLATGGLLESTLKTPQTLSQLDFIQQEKNADITIKGLNEFWQQITTIKTTLEIIFNKQDHIKKEIPFRSDRVKHYAVEFICWKILLHLAQ